MSARFSLPTSVAASLDGIIYVADKLNSAIRKIETKIGKVSTLAGKKGVRSVIKDGNIEEATFQNPVSLIIDKQGNILVSEAEKIRVIPNAAKPITVRAHHRLLEDIVKITELEKQQQLLIIVQTITFPVNIHLASIRCPALLQIST